MKKFVRIILCLFLVLSLFGCSNQTEETPADNTEETQVNETQTVSVIEGPESFYETKRSDYGYIMMYDNPAAAKAYQKYRDFSNRFLYNAGKDGNQIVSPLSLYYVLAILANGAAGNSRAQIENVLGMCTDDLNHFLKDVDETDLRGYERMYGKANALWFNVAKGLSLRKDFYETVVEYYGESIDQYDFSDQSGLVDQANAWAKKNTDGLIDHVLENNDVDDSTMFLVLNALATGSNWMFKFDSKDTNYQEFNNYDRSVNLVEMMNQQLDGYWSDGNSEGFVKMLENGLNFVAMMPKTNMDIYDYLNTMDPDAISRFMSSVIYDENYEETKTGWGCAADYHFTNLSFPKFKYEKEYELKEVLSKMGLAEIFDFQTCDFSNMATGDEKMVSLLEVKDIKQKCTIEVNEEEVVAAAVTVAVGGLGAGGCEMRKEIYHDIVFDHPFVFFIVENGGELAMPLFMGVVTNLGEPIEKAMKIENITGKINIRSIPSTKGEKLGFFNKGETYYSFETKESEGYTWYRIGEDKWVADKNGEWIKVIPH